MSQQAGDDIVGEVAWLYYIKQLTQGEIATRLSLSRPTIISYLKLARERRIVCISVDPVHLRRHALAERLKERFSLASVHVVPERAAADRPVLHRVCEAAAQFLPRMLGPGDTLGVSWGQTLWRVTGYVPDWPIDSLTVRQLIGSLANPVVETSESCTTEIAKRLSAACVNLNAPAVCTSAELARALRREPIIAEQIGDLNRCNKAIYSLSPCTRDTSVVQLKIATRDEIARYRRDGAVAILAGRFIDRDGQQVAGVLDERLMAVEVNSLREMEGLLVVSGATKAVPTLAALRGGFVDHLVSDDVLAERLLAIR